jgi:hypothetical protein
LAGAPTFNSHTGAQHPQNLDHEDAAMARRYSKGAQRKVKKVIEDCKSGTLWSDRSGKKVQERQGHCDWSLRGPPGRQESAEEEE